MTECTLVTKKGMVKKVADATPKKLQAALKSVRLSKDETVELIMDNGREHVKHS